MISGSNWKPIRGLSISSIFRAGLVQAPNYWDGSKGGLRCDPVVMQFMLPVIQARNDLSDESQRVFDR